MLVPVRRSLDLPVRCASTPKAGGAMTAPFGGGSR